MRAPTTRMPLRAAAAVPPRSLPPRRRPTVAASSSDDETITDRRALLLASTLGAALAAVAGPGWADGETVAVEAPPAPAPALDANVSV